MVVATFRVSPPELRETLAGLPDLSARLAEMRAGSSSGVHAFFWLLGPVEPGAVEDALAADASVESARRLVSTDDGWLYRLEFAAELAGSDAYAGLVDLDGSILDASSADGRWTVRVFVPSRRELSRFFERSRDVGLDPSLTSLTDHDGGAGGDGFGLTESQRRTLIAAAELGYFAVPKEVSLIELADHLGVSDQAVSERLRRGMNSLVLNTLVADDRLETAPLVF